MKKSEGDMEAYIDKQIFNSKGKVLDPNFFDSKTSTTFIPEKNDGLDEDGYKRYQVKARVIRRR